MSAASNQSSLRKFCCAVDVFAMWPNGLQPNSTYNIGRCAPHKHRSYYNAEVTKYARSTKGVYITLSDEAQKLIKEAYEKIDQQPLFVHTAKPWCHWGMLFACCVGVVEGCLPDECAFCSSVCANGHNCKQACQFATYDKYVIDGIWFAQKDAPSTCFSGSHLCCPSFLAINGCRQPDIIIPKEDIKLVDLRDIQDNGPDKVATATVVEVQPGYIMGPTFPEMVTTQAVKVVVRIVRDRVAETFGVPVGNTDVAGMVADAARKVSVPGRH